ncbi:hypothetical protein REPUB_Repub15cG0142100 [Reevesia pubescens]
MLPLHRAVRYNLCRLSAAASCSRQTPLPFRSLEKMNPTQKPPPTHAGFSSKQQITAQKPYGNVYSTEETRQFSGSTSKNEKESQSSYELEFPSLTVNMGSSSKGRNFDKSRNKIDTGLEPRLETVNSSEVEGIVNVGSLQDERSSLSPFCDQSVPDNGVGTENSDYSKGNRRRTRINLGLESEGNKRRSTTNLGLEPKQGTVNSSERERIVNNAISPSHFGRKKVQTSYVQKSPSGQSKSKNVVDTENSDNSEGNIGLELRHETVNSSALEEMANIASLQEEHSLPSHFGEKKTQSSYVQKSPSSQSKFKNSDYSEGNLGLELRHETVNSSELEEMVNIASLQEEHSLPSHFGKKVHASYVQKSPSGQSKSKNVVGAKSSDCSEGLHKVERFSICLPRNKAFETREILRPGMVLLKSYISLRDQINIVKTCTSLGEGPGGFYRPGYKEGAKLSLHMMCLGLNWDPQTRKYDKRHPVDDCEPPNIPHEFRVLVLRAIQEAHCLIKKDSHLDNPEEVLPSMSPDICIANFYTRNGRLGLHQDRDESRESLHKGLPVVSFSIGDSAEFLYGDQRDVNQAEKVLLDSGDVLLFGGESRMVFHGVPSIIPFSAPDALLAETGLRRGRLNLTFRQY